MPLNNRFAGDFDEGIIVRPPDQIQIHPPLPLPPSNSAQLLDAAAGTMLGLACGDALGVPYEYGPPPIGEAEMLGGGLGNYAPGEWSDDTQMAICIARVAATGEPLASRNGLEQVAASFEGWFASDPADVGVQTSRVLENAAATAGPARLRLATAATRLHAETGRTAGNGALMRTAPIALSAPHDRNTVALAARSVAELTHTDPLAGDSCVLWSEAIRIAMTEQRFDLATGVDLLPTERQHAWQTWIADSEQTSQQAKLAANGFTVTALQAAWHAIVTTTDNDKSPTTHIHHALQAAIKIGGDTDTIAAIAGSLLGARWGAREIPSQWRAIIHGWPGLRAHDLTELARAIVQAVPPRHAPRMTRPDAPRQVPKAT